MKHRNALKVLFIILSLTAFFSCSRGQTQIHIHDRHGLSYDYVKAYAQAHGPVTLVLLDYHHDINFDSPVLTSYNWVGNLIEENYVNKVIWLSGKKLLLPNRNSRMAWLERSLQGAYPQTVEKIKQTLWILPSAMCLWLLKKKKKIIVSSEFKISSF